MLATEKLNVMKVIIAERKRQLEQSEKELVGILPELEKMEKPEEGVEVEVFKGLEGVKTILNHVVETGSDNHVFPVTGVLFELLPVFYTCGCENALAFRPMDESQHL